MLNGKTVNVKMKRIELCDLLIATTCITIDQRNEYNAPTTSEDRKQILAGSMKKWEALHDMLRAQLDAFDEKHAEE